MNQHDWEVAPEHHYDTRVSLSSISGFETLLNGLEAPALGLDESTAAAVKREITKYREAMIEILIHVNAAQEAVNKAQKLARVSIASLPKH